MSAQVAHLLETGADVGGLDRILFYDPLRARAWERRASAEEAPALAGGTLCYRKGVWRDGPFPDVSAGEADAFGAKRTRAALHLTDPASVYVALIHPSNAAPTRPAAPEWEPRPVETVRAVLGTDCAYYDTVFRSDVGGRRERSESSVRAGASCDGPLVSCLMPTFNRGIFVPQAIRCFLAQEYPYKELIIVDDGGERVGHAVPADGPIRYVSLDQRLSLGEKRNLAAALSNGEILAHWDDDDWYGPRYLAQLVKRLRQAGCDSLSGFSRYLVYLLPTGSLKVAASRGPAGASFCYWKRIWERHPYRDTTRAEDYFFLEDARPRVVCLQEQELFAIVRHRNHTWTHEHGRDVTRRLTTLPPYKKPIGAIVGAETAAFYEHARQLLFATRPSREGRRH